MKVLMLFNDYLQAGGERVSVATEVRALKEAGVDVSLLEVDNARLADASSLTKARATFPNPESDLAVRRAISDFEPTIVHAQNLFPQLGAGAIRAIQHAGIPWVRTIRNYRKGCIAGTYTRDGETCRDCSGALGRLPGIRHACYQGSRAASLGATNYALWDHLAEKSYPPSTYILISEAMRAGIADALHPQPRVRVVHNAVGVTDGPPRNLIANRKFDVSIVGRLTPEKGIRIALDLARTNADLSFAFAGSGPLADDVYGLAQSQANVTYMPDLDGAGALALMRQSRVVAVPSQWDEPFGRVAAEALASGALPLVSNRGGLPEIVAPLGSDLVVRSKDAAVWGNALRAILSCPVEELEIRSESAQRLWAEQFSTHAVAGRLIDVYAEALGTQPRPEVDP